MTAEPEWAYPKFPPYAFGVPQYMHACQSFPPAASSSYAPRPGSWDAAPSPILHSYPYGGYAPPYGTVVGTPVPGTAVRVGAGVHKEPVQHTSPECVPSPATSPQHTYHELAASPVTSPHHTPQQLQDGPATSAQHTSHDFARTPVTSPHRPAHELLNGPVTSAHHTSPDFGASQATSPQVRRITEAQGNLIRRINSSRKSATPQTTLSYQALHTSLWFWMHVRVYPLGS
jgi:hypothetical protein